MNYWSTHLTGPVVIPDQILDNSTGFGGISIYPNPVSDAAKLHISSTISGRLSITIYNSSGRRVKKVQMQADRGADLLLNIEEMPEGMYFLELANGLISYKQKFIKL
jgi:hypothetical protein